MADLVPGVRVRSPGPAAAGDDQGGRRGGRDHHGRYQAGGCAEGEAEGGAPPGPTDRQILIPTRLTSVTLPCFLPETWAQITSYCSPRVAFRGTVMLAVSVALWRGPRSTAGLLTW